MPDIDQLKRLSDLRKVEPAPASLLESVAQQETAAAIIKVSEADYVPAGIHVRARMSPTLFTGAFSPDLLSLLDDDDKVVSVSLQRRQRLIG